MSIIFSHFKLIERYIWHSRHYHAINNKRLVSTLNRSSPHLNCITAFRSNYARPLCCVHTSNSANQSPLVHQQLSNLFDVAYHLSTSIVCDAIVLPSPFLCAFMLIAVTIALFEIPSALYSIISPNSPICCRTGITIVVL